MPIHQLNPYSCVLPETLSEGSSLASLREKLDYEGIVVVDEACIDLSEPARSSVTSIRRRRCAKALGSQESGTLRFSFLSIALTTATHLGPHKYQGAISYNDFTPGTHLALRTVSRVGVVGAMRKKVEMLRASRNYSPPCTIFTLGHAQDASFRHSRGEALSR
jgi:hypothetical protein